MGKWEVVRGRFASGKSDWKRLANIILPAENSVNSALDENGWRALHFCGLGGNSQAAIRLLLAGAKVDIQTATGATPLMMAVFNNKPNVAFSLLQHEANLNVVDEKDEDCLIKARLVFHSNPTAATTATVVFHYLGIPTFSLENSSSVVLCFTEQVQFEIDTRNFLASLQISYHAEHKEVVLKQKHIVEHLRGLSERERELFSSERTFRRVSSPCQSSEQPPVSSAVQEITESHEQSLKDAKQRKELLLAEHSRMAREYNRLHFVEVHEEYTRGSGRYDRKCWWGNKNSSDSIANNEFITRSLIRINFYVNLTSILEFSKREQIIAEQLLIFLSICFQQHLFPTTLLSERCERLGILTQQQYQFDNIISSNPHLPMINAFRRSVFLQVQLIRRVDFTDHYKLISAEIAHLESDIWIEDVLPLIAKTMSDHNFAVKLRLDAFTLVPHEIDEKFFRERIELKRSMDLFILYSQLCNEICIIATTSFMMCRLDVVISEATEFLGMEVASERIAISFIKQTDFFQMQQINEQRRQQRSAFQLREAEVRKICTVEIDISVERMKLRWTNLRKTVSYLYQNVSYEYRERLNNLESEAKQFVVILRSCSLQRRELVDRSFNVITSLEILSQLKDSALKPTMLKTRTRYFLIMIIGKVIYRTYIIKWIQWCAHRRTSRKKVCLLDANSKMGILYHAYGALLQFKIRKIRGRGAVNRLLSSAVVQKKKILTCYLGKLLTFSFYNKKGRRHPCLAALQFYFAEKNLGVSMLLSSVLLKGPKVRSLASVVSYPQETVQKLPAKRLLHRGNKSCGKIMETRTRKQRVVSNIIKKEAHQPQRPKPVQLEPLGVGRYLHRIQLLRKKQEEKHCKRYSLKNKTSNTKLSELSSPIPVIPRRRVSELARQAVETLQQKQITALCLPPRLPPIDFHKPLLLK